MNNQYTLRDLQLLEARILHDFKEVCDKYNLTYYLSSGTLLGAVRHGGFIPWDDDIDVSMPYADYLKFLEIAQDELGEEYFVQSSWTDDNYYRAYSKIRMNNTTYLDKYHVKYDIHHGVWIDIFPLVEINQGIEFKMKKSLIKFINCLQMENYIDSHYSEFQRTVGKKRLILMKMLYKFPLCLRKRIHKLLLDYVGKGTKKEEYTEIWASITKTYPKAIYDGKECCVEFEGEAYRVPSQYKEYLRITYGDYMQLPPEEARGGHGNNVILDLENDYRIYMKLPTR